MREKTTISNIALAKQILGEKSNSFKIIEQEPELFEVMFPGLMEYVNTSNEEEKKHFIEALSLMTEIEEAELASAFADFIYPVKVIKGKLKIN